MTLIDYLLRPDIASLSDDAALAAASVPIKTPRPNPITWTTLNGSGVWGFNKTAAFKATLRAVIAMGGNNGAAADNLFGLLDGDGLYPNDPQVEAMAPNFVALGNGSITSDDVAKALYVSITYPTGESAPPTLEDIQAVRERIVPLLMLEQANRDRYNANVEKLAALRTSTDPVPATLAEVDAMGAG